MGCDIHSVAQKRGANGQWQDLGGTYGDHMFPDQEPFGCRSYAAFAFLAGVRNYYAVTPISEPRGFPEDFRSSDSWLGEEYAVDRHSDSWLSVAELLAFDYDQPIENRRNYGRSGPDTLDPGQGEMTTYREFLGKGFFSDLEKLVSIGAERIVFGFDN